MSSSVRLTDRMSRVQPDPHQRESIRGSRKGLAGGGWQETGPKAHPESISRIVHPFS